MNWLIASILSLLCFGLWGLFSKFSVLYVDFKSAFVYQALGVVLTGILTLGLLQFKPAASIKGAGFGLLTGVAYGIGCLFFLIAASKGKIITVVTMTALYPLVTILFTFLLLNETVSLKQGLGIVLGLGAIVLLST